METQTMNLTNVKSDSLPLDLMMKILKRLPVKTLIRFLSVSKLWASTIRSRDFMKLLLNVSLTRPKGLLFLFRHGSCGLVLSQNTHESSSFTSFRVSCYSPQWSTVSPSVHGSICYAQATRLVIYNPCTRRSITLPEIDTWRRPIRYYLGHDPIDNDVRSERLYPSKGPITLLRSTSSKLISYEGKLAAILFGTNFVRLCVLEDVGKEEWSTKTVVSSTVPPIHWGGNFRSTETDTGEIIFAPHSLHASVLNLVYYDIKTNSAETVYMRGSTTDRTCYYTLSVSSNLVENLMFL